jgi:hypothetical protein
MLGVPGLLDFTCAPDSLEVTWVPLSISYGCQVVDNGMC